MNDLLKAKKIFRRLSIMLFASIIMMLFLCSCRTINMVDSAETVLNGSLNIKELEDTTNPEKQVAIVKENNEFGTTQEKKIETTISPGSRLLYVLQNAEELTIYPAYIDAIDGVGKESLWFYGEKRGDKAATDSSLFYLSRLDELGKFVFVISYVEKIANQKEFLDLAKSHGFIPYIGRLELDTIEDICNPDI